MVVMAFVVDWYGWVDGGVATVSFIQISNRLAAYLALQRLAQSVCCR